MTLYQLVVFVLAAQVAVAAAAASATHRRRLSEAGDGRRVRRGAALELVSHDALLRHVATGNSSSSSSPSSSRDYSDGANEEADDDDDDERHDDGGHRKKTKKGAKKKKKKKKHHGFFSLMKKMKKHLPDMVHKMHGPSMFMMGMAQANFHNFVMHALMMSKMALTTVVVMILREMVFGDKDQPVKYYNFGYDHHRRTSHPSSPYDYNRRRKRRLAVVA